MNRLIKKQVIKSFEEWAEGAKEIGYENLSARDFDSWVGGFISGLSFGQIFPEITEEDFTDIINHLVKSDIAKSLGITGTLKEKLKFRKIHE